MSHPAKGLYMTVLKNFINSLRPRQIRGNLMGEDYLGNKYFEIPPDPSIGKRKTNRWFEPPANKDFQHEMPAEWESWLRGRRKEVPSQEEIARNVAIMELKKKNAVLVEAKAGMKTPRLQGMESFPDRPEYELIPGKKKE